MFEERNQNIDEKQQFRGKSYANSDHFPYFNQINSLETYDQLLFLLLHQNHEYLNQLLNYVSINSNHLPTNIESLEIWIANRSL